LPIHERKIEKWRDWSKLSTASNRKNLNFLALLNRILMEVRLTDSGGTDDRTNSRRQPELRNQQLAVLAELSQSDVVGKIEAVFADKHEPLTMKR